jgi:hypothetical protein
MMWLVMVDHLMVWHNFVVLNWHVVSSVGLDGLGMAQVRVVNLMWAC